MVIQVYVCAGHVHPGPAPADVYAPRKIRPPEVLAMTDAEAAEAGLGDRRREIFQLDGWRLQYVMVN